MIYKISCSLVLFILFFSVQSIAQSALSDAEVQDFYQLIKQTNEYKTMKKTIDSVNKRDDQIPQEINFRIIKQEGSADDTYLFQALVSRRLLGLQLEECGFIYNRKKKQIVSINH